MDPQSSSPGRREADYAALQKPLEHFRANTKRLKIHPLELAALWIVCAHLVFLPWAIGGMRLWGQIPSLVLSIIGFIVALVPRDYTEEHTGSNTFRLIMWPKTCCMKTSANAETRYERKPLPADDSGRMADGRSLTTEGRRRTTDSILGRRRLNSGPTSVVCRPSETTRS